MERSAAVRDHARRLGFDLVGIAPPMAGIAHERYAAAMAQGYGAEMDWLKDNPQVRSDVREVHPSARAVVTVTDVTMTELITELPAGPRSPSPSIRR